MKKSALTRLGVGTASVALLLTAVVGNTTSSTAAGTRGGTLYVLTAGDDILHLDPQRNYTGEDMAFASAFLTRTLTQYTYNANPAKASTVIGDGATTAGTKMNGGKDWKFPIRKGMKWEDGTTVLCSEFKYGISRTFAVNDIFDGPTYAISYLDIPADADSDNGTEYPGPYDATPTQQAKYDAAVQCTGKPATGEFLTIHLNQVVADFSGATTLPEFAAVKPSADTGTTYDHHLLSNGPYKIDSYVSGDHLTLVRNTNWASATDATRPAYPDVVQYEFNITPQVVTERIMADNGADSTAVSPDGIYPTYLGDVMAAGSAYSTRKIVGFDPYVSYTAINTSHITSLAKRKAIMASWPRATLRTLSGGDYAGSFADGVIKPSMGADYKPTNIWGYNTFKTTHHAAVAAVVAKKVGSVYKCGTVVRSAGYVCTAAAAAYDTVVTTPHPGALGYVVPDNGSCSVAQAILADGGITNPGSLTYDYSDKGSPITAQASAAIKSALECAGFTVTLHGIASGYYSKVLNPATQGDLSNAGWGPDWANASTVIPPLFQLGNSFDLSRYDNQAFQDKITAAMANTNRGTQAKQWQQLNADAMAAGLAVPKLFTTIQRLQGSDVKNAYISCGQALRCLPTHLVKH
ncbi:MAG: ABC transporter substrate-binding protein [Actinobacteria bacterium]|nr:ABC transporter substrate-binding protein [Actinomycetota bacterium]